MRLDMLAAQTWDQKESLEDTNARIHDGVAGDKELQERADHYVQHMVFGNFPQALPTADARILEIGSGVGWIMQSMKTYLDRLGASPKQLIGLDIAPNMLAKARARLGASEAYTYLIYDGINIPLEKASLDLVYSVACLQHIPRPFVFNLFYEIRRLLKSTGFAVLHFLSTDWLPYTDSFMSWRNEIDNQLSGAKAHWHHYYTAKELHDVLKATGFEYVAVRNDGRDLIACIASAQLSLPNDFDPEVYLLINKDIARDEDPIPHYLTFGHAEGRKWFFEHRPISNSIADYHFRSKCAKLLGEIARVAERCRILEDQKTRSDGEIAALHERHHLLENQNATLVAELKAIRSSTSWRATAPLRALMRKIGRSDW